MKRRTLNEKVAIRFLRGWRGEAAFGASPESVATAGRTDMINQKILKMISSVDRCSWNEIRPDFLQPAERG